MADLGRANADSDMRIIPVTRDEFKWLSNPRFVSFLRSVMGAKRSTEGFLRISKSQT